MNTFESLWPKFKKNKQYRDAFVAQHAKTEIGFQIRALLKQYELTQKQLADRAGLTQGVVSRAADPSYGKLTINTLVRIAAGFDVAFVGRFVPFSELPKWFDRLETAQFAIPTFEQEDATLSEESHEDAAEITTEQIAMMDQSTTSATIEMSPQDAGAAGTVLPFAPQKFERKPAKKVDPKRQPDPTKASANA